MSQAALLATIAANPADAAPYLAYADWLNENNFLKEEEAYRQKAAAMAKIPPELVGYDWHETFHFAGEEGSCSSGGSVPEWVKPGEEDADVSLAPFGRADVKHIIALQEGENDGQDWICVGQLFDGRFFVVRAWCDYTGWG